VELKEQLLEHIKKNGLKKSYVADKIGITPSTMSNYLHGNLIITDTLEQRIKDYLDGQN
jgi:predicted transcriptional regulator